MPPHVALRVLSEHVSDGLTIQDASGRLVYANDVAARRSGHRNVAQLLANPSSFIDRFDMFDEDGHPLKAEDLPGPKAMKDGRAERRLIKSVNRIDKQVHWSVVQADPVLGPDGHVEFVINTVQDVTAKRRTEEQLRRREGAALFIVEAAHVLSQSLNPQATLAQVAALAVPRLADWCVVDLLQAPDRLEAVAIAHADPLRVELARDLRRRQPPSPEDPVGVWSAIRDRSPVTYEVTDELIDQSIADEDLRDDLKRLGIRSVIIVPLLVRGGVLGAITLVWGEPGRTPAPEDLAVAQELAGQAALALENARLYEERGRISRALQTALLPASLPQLSGWDLAARYWPAGAGMEVGGDFYDAFERPDGSFGLVVGDVCGKGPEAAAIMGVSRQTVRAAGVLETRPSAILAVLNEALLMDRTDLFCTACDIRIYPTAGGGGRMTVCLAGHPAPVLVRSDGTVKRIGEHGTALGLFAEIRLIDKEEQLRPGDSVVMFSDGLIEFRGQSREGDLIRILSQVAQAPASVVVSEVERWFLAEESNPRADDAVVLVLTCNPG